MFRLLLFIISILSVTGSAAQEFILTGRIAGVDNGRIYLYYTDAFGKKIRDSSVVKGGIFSFKGQVTEPTVAYINLKEDRRTEGNSGTLFLEPGAMQADLRLNEFRKAVVAGSASHAEWLELEQSKESLRKEIEPLSKEYERAGEQYRQAVKDRADDKTLEAMKEKAAAIQARFAPFNQRSDAIDYRFFETHPASYVTAYMMRFHVSELSLDSLKLFYGRFNDKVKQSSFGREVWKEIEQLESGSPGAIAKNFTTTDINGNQLGLYDFKGKYVLIDFWASWCVPCRKGNPHLREVYAKYRNKGFEIIGIADDDRAEDAWRKAVEKDGIGIWKHVRRGLKMTNGEYDHSTDISENFGIHTLPTKILIDPAGKIIGRFGEEEEPLDEMLKKIFGN